MSRYRQLRGVVRHVLPRVRAGRATGRDPMGGVGFWHRSRVFGVCRWCGFTVEPPARTWHQDCLLQYSAMRGESVPPEGLETCEMCGRPGEEVDHRVAASVARRLGPRSFVRACLLENLRWLCRPCHRLKTAEDRRFLVPDRPPRKPASGKRTPRPVSVRAGARLPGL